MPASLLIHSGTDERKLGEIIGKLLLEDPEAELCLLSCLKPPYPYTFVEHRELTLNGGGIADFEDISDISPDSVYVYLGDKLHRILPVALYQELFSRAGFGIREIDDELNTRPYQPLRNKHTSTLLVFPGQMLPLSMGSHQRGFNLAYNLNARGIYCDLLITGGEDLPAVRSLLKSVVPDVYAYKNKKKKLPRKTRLLRRTEIILRKLLGYQSGLPDTYAERSRLKPTESSRRWLYNLIRTKKYKNVIISYSWMADITEYSRAFPDVNWICDTHDIQYVRNTSTVNEQTRILASRKKEKALELAHLDSMDYILAISEADAEAVRTEINPGKVILAPAGFDYCFHPIEPGLGKKNLFGFLGRDMEANVIALEHVLKEWWPVIIASNPHSELRIAGTVGLNPRIRSLASKLHHVNILGGGVSLRNYYQSIDVALSPVFIRGGLNFKNIEALFAGKQLVTNTLGFERLTTEEAVCHIVDQPADLKAFLETLQSSEDQALEMRRRGQGWARAKYSSDVTYAELFKILEGVG